MGQSSSMEMSDILAHEIRVPLSCIMMSLRRLAHEADTVSASEKKKLLRITYFESQLVLSMVNSLLDWR
jgi:K+-sensing histidine kinase KdpD